MRISDWSPDVCSSDLEARCHIGTESGMEARRDRLANVGLEVISHGIFARRVAREQQGEYRREQRMSCKEAILRIHYGKDENPAVWVRPRRHSSAPDRKSTRLHTRN